MRRSVPRRIRRFGFAFPLRLQFVQVFGCDLALAGSVKEMIKQDRREVRPLDLRHLDPKGHAR